MMALCDGLGYFCFIFSASLLLRCWLLTNAAYTCTDVLDDAHVPRSVRIMSCRCVASIAKPPSKQPRYLTRRY
ncbi:hypothetical protein V8C40DRAFT_233489 [Trichoderma camerunense]